MLKKETKVALFLLIFLGYFLINTSNTSADLFDEDIVHSNKIKATTLDLSQRNTANNNKTSSLFSIYDMKPGGFDVRAVRIKKDGKMNFKYRFKTDITPGNNLCDNLDAEVWKGRDVVYNGPLKELRLDQTINQQDNWIIFLELNKDSADLKNKTCNFNFVFKTWVNNDPDLKKGFWDEEKLNNNVTTENW